MVVKVPPREKAEVGAGVVVVGVAVAVVASGFFPNRLPLKRLPLVDPEDVSPGFGTLPNKEPPGKVDPVTT
jgi:hypothetical protein